MYATKQLYHQYLQTDYFKRHLKSFQQWLAMMAAK